MEAGARRWFDPGATLAFISDSARMHGGHRFSLCLAQELLFLGALLAIGSASAGGLGSNCCPMKVD
jgi:hypothetical protein